MMHIKDLSIKRKLIAIQLLTVFIVLVFFCVFVISSDLHALRKSIISQLTSMAQLIGANSVSSLNFLDSEAAGEILSSLEAEKEFVNAWIHNADGVLFAKYSKDGYMNFSFPKLEEETYVFQTDYTSLTKRILQEGETIGTISLRFSMAQSRSLVRQKIMITLLVLVFGMIFALILSHVTQRTISRPVLKLVGISKKVSEIDDYSVRVEKEANDEIGILCDTYNDMMAQIGKRAAERDKAEETLKQNNMQLQQEIKERRLAEEQLSIFRKFAEASGQGLGIADLNGNIIYANPALCSIFGDENMEVHFGKNIELYYPEEHIKKLKEEVIPTVLKEDHWVGELPLLSLNKKVIPCIQSVFLIRDDNGNACNLANVITDITNRKRVEQALQKQLEFENLIATISTNFIDMAPDKIDSSINQALQTIGEFADVDRSYIILFSENKTKMDYTHEWCAEGIESEIGDFKDVPIDLFPYFADKIRNQEIIHVPRITDLPEEAKVEKELLPSKGIQSVLNIPMIYSGRLVGLLGMHSIRKEKLWPDDFVAQLKIVGEMFVNSLENKRVEEELAKHRNHLEDLVETRTIELTNTNKQLQQEINDRKQAEEALRKSEASLANAQRIAHLGNWDWDIKRNELHWSDEIFRIFGLNPQEFGVTFDAFMNSVHPDDRELVKKSVDEALHQKMPYSIDHRIVRPDGSELIVHEHAEVFFDVTGHPVRMSGTVQDVTEDKEAEEKLMLYRKIFLNSKDGIIIMDSDGKLIERNPAHQFLSRYEDDDLLGKTVAPFTGEETYQHFISELKENRIYRGEFLAHRKDGSPIHIDLSAFSIEHDNGELVCFVGISRDITERKNVEKALATRLRYEEGLAACSRTLLTEARTGDAINEALHFLLKAANTSRVYIFENFDDDSDGLCMRQIHEVCAEGVEPQIDDPLLQHAPYKLGFHRWRETLSRGEPINGLLETFPTSEQEILIPQGNLSMLVIPIMVERSWYGFIGFDDVREKREWSDEDIRALQTASEMIGIYIERKKFDELLRVSEERFRSLVENANDIIYSLSPKGEITYISPKFTDIMGYEVTEFLGNSFFPFIHPDDAKDSIEWFRSIMKDKPRKTGYEYRFRHKDGSIRWMAGHSSVIRDEDGNIFEIIGVAHDFTKMKNVLEDLEDANRDLRETQSQLVQSAKMASLGQLVAGIAHEINTPIGAVNSMQDTLFRSLEKLKKTIKTEFPKKYEKQPRFKSALSIMDDSKKVIQSGTERVINIVRRLRSFARLDEAELKTVDIHEGIEDTLTLIRHEIKHNITVKKNYGDIPPIACYPGKLNQVFLNILVNAKQAIEDTGEIEINTFTKQKKVYIEIKDNGSGITQKNLKKVFDPGFTTKGVGVGTGLGLSICYQIIQDHRGDLKVKSTREEGTTFTIIIPINLDEILNENQTEAKV